MAISDLILNEKLRPKKLDEIILLDRIRQQISEDIPQHLLLTGTQGTGKTSLLKILASKYTTKFINASSEARIDMLRDGLEDFCSTKPFDGNSIKVVILDEIDFASPTFFAALRPLIEKYKHIRFLATANYENKIPDPIYSRFLHINFNPINSEEEKELILKYGKRIIDISKELEIKWKSKEILNEFIKEYFPDLRSIITKLQSFQIAKKQIITIEDVKNSHYSFIDLYKLCISKPNPSKNFQLINSEYSTKVTDIFYAFSKEFPEWLLKNTQSENKLAQILITIAKYEFQSRGSIDPMLQLLAMIFEIQTIYNM